MEMDNTGTQAPADRLRVVPVISGTDKSKECNKLDQAAAVGGSAISGELDIDDLFAGEDIDSVEEDLENLELEDESRTS